MLHYLGRRLLGMIPALLGVSLFVFGIIHLIPGDPVSMLMGNVVDPEARAVLMARYGLDRPLHLQYFEWLGRVLRGDLGQSIQTSEPVSRQIAERLPRTVYLLIGSVFVAVTIALPSGILAAARHNTWTDLSVTTMSLIALSTPSFWLAIILMLIFAVQLRVLPATGYVEPTQDLGGFFRHMIIPCISMGAIEAALFTRIVRSSMLDALQQEYITLARAKGAGERRVLFIHALRNAAVPVATVIGLEIGYLLGGAVIIERVFAYPGMGYLLISAVSRRDYPVIQGTILVFASLFFLVNLITDVVYTLLDPRIRYS